jgi:hypothetical protein
MLHLQRLGIDTQIFFNGVNGLFLAMPTTFGRFGNGSIASLDPSKLQNGRNVIVVVIIIIGIVRVVDMTMILRG